MVLRRGQVSANRSDFKWESADPRECRSGESRLYHDLAKFAGINVSFWRVCAEASNVRTPSSRESGEAHWQYREGIIDFCKSLSQDSYNKLYFLGTVRIR